MYLQHCVKCSLLRISRSQTPSDEDRSLALLPVREFVVGFVGGSMGRIEGQLIGEGVLGLGGCVLAGSIGVHGDVDLEGTERGFSYPLGLAVDCNEAVVDGLREG